MKRLSLVSFIALGIICIWVIPGIAGPTVAIVKHDDHKLVGESWSFEVTRTPKGEPPDKYWRPQWSKESEAAIERMVRDAVRLAGGWPVKSGDVVAVVPNLVISPFGCVLQGRTKPELLQCAVTDVRVARAVAMLAKESGAKKVYFATQPMAASVVSAMKAWGYWDVGKELGVELVALDSAPWKYYKPAHAPLALKEYAIPNIIVEEVNKVISVPAMKTHCLAGYTGAMKNIGIGVPTGQVYGSIRYGLPHEKLAKVIVDVCSIVKINYSVVSAIWAQDGNGPLAGDPVAMDLVIAGADPVAVDAVMVDCMGQKAHIFGQIRLAEEAKLGTSKGITVTGRQVHEVEKQFVGVPPDKRAAASWGEIIGWPGKGVTLTGSYAR
jgi:uncharacterized protein (DUF362 family)